jgi:hypothetical protein
LSPAEKCLARRIEWIVYERQHPRMLNHNCKLSIRNRALLCGCSRGTVPKWSAAEPSDVRATFISSPLGHSDFVQLAVALQSNDGGLRHGDGHFMSGYWTPAPMEPRKRLKPRCGVDAVLQTGGLIRLLMNEVTPALTKRRASGSGAIGLSRKGSPYEGGFGSSVGLPVEGRPIR